jgi:hypothetical protein
MGDGKRPPNYKGGHKKDGCAVAALALAGGMLTMLTGVGYGAVQIVMAIV